jgi:hypothetical protein
MKKNIELNVLILGHVSHAQEQVEALCLFVKYWK